jgi:hypothetical protein
MSFTASALGESTPNFSAGSKPRIVYDGDYVKGPVDISVTAHELGRSDDTFTADPLSMEIDPNKLTGSAEVNVTMTSEASPPGLSKGRRQQSKLHTRQTASDKDESANYTLAFINLVIPAPKLVQTNFPEQSGEKEITKDGIAYITDEPKMPALVARVDPPTNKQVKWSLDVDYSRRRKAGKNPHFEKTLAGDKDWDLSEEFKKIELDKIVGSFFGGDAVLTCKVADQSEQKITFSIKGKNPKDAVVKAFIEQQQGIHFYAWAIAQHESRDPNDKIYNQFNTYYPPLEEPLATGNGWGVFQRDPKHKGFEVTSDQVWNWKTNVMVAIKELDSKRAIAQGVRDKLYITRNQNEPWEEPPESYNIDRTPLNWLDIATITLYNAGVRSAQLWFRNGISYGQAENPPKKLLDALRKEKDASDPSDFARAFCWVWKPSGPATKRWTLVFNKTRGNPKGYTYRVITDEYQPETKKPIKE